MSCQLTEFDWVVCNVSHHTGSRRRKLVTLYLGQSPVEQILSSMFVSICKLLALASLLERAAAFTTATTLLPLRTHGPRHAITASPGGVVAATSPAFAECSRVATPKMGLFGLGWAELGVIGVIALFFFGPEKLAPLAKDFGKSASGLKVGAKSWSPALLSSLSQSDHVDSHDSGGSR